MKRARVCSVWASLLFFAAGIAPAGAQPQELHLTAFVDGKSTLCFTPKGLQWKHLVFSKPGLYEGQNHPTLINNTPWFPEWTNSDPRAEDTSSVFPFEKPGKIVGVKIISCSQDRDRAEITYRYELSYTPAELTIFDIASGPHWYRLHVYLEK